MLLQFEGIRVCEGEMAVACLTNSASATDEFNVRRGIRQKLCGTGKDVKLEVLDFHSLIYSRSGPMMAVIRFEHLLDHWVVIRSISKDGEIEVLDPKGEIRRYSAAEFESIWRNCILSITQPS